MLSEPCPPALYTVSYLIREITAMRDRNQNRGQERLKMHGSKENSPERRKNDVFMTSVLLVPLTVQN